MTRVIGPPLTFDERAAFVAAARSLIDVRWQHQGRDKRGIDCAGLVVFALKKIGRSVSDAVGYGRLPYRGTLEKFARENLGEPFVCKDSGAPMPIGITLQVGDVPLMRWVGSAPYHCGIIADYPFGGFSLIHAFAQNKKVVEHRIDDQWMRNFVEIYRP